MRRALSSDNYIGALENEFQLGTRKIAHTLGEKNFIYNHNLGDGDAERRLGSIMWRSCYPACHVLTPNNFQDTDEMEEPAKAAGFGGMKTVRTLDNATIDGLSRRLADTYNGSKLAVKFLIASGWGPLLNLGYFELKQLPSLIGGLNHFQRYLVKKSVELLNPQPNESILDLACT